MASTIGTAYIQIEPSTKGIGKSLEKEMGSAGTEAGKGFNLSMGKIIGATAVIGVAKKGAEMTKEFVSGAVSAFGSYEQLVGGVETLFGAGGASLEEYAASQGKEISEVKDQWYSLMSAQKEVLSNADNAYKTAGLSANDYMETVTSFSAALVNSLDGDTKAAAEKADTAIVDMADNANKMGTSMESIQNAYQGFAKQNYTMLDNLKLGYGGTKTEMQRLLEEAHKISGIKYDISSYADVVDAIHIIQENMGIAGTTAKEAEQTLQGSLASMKASWENLTVALGKGEGMDEAINRFVESAEIAIGNFLPVIERSLQGVSNLIDKLLPVIVEKIPALLQTVLPTLISTGVTILKALAQGIITSIPILLPTLLDLVNQITEMLIELAPQLIQVGLELLLALSLGIAEALPTLMPAIVDVILTINDYLIQNVDLLIAAAVALVGGLVKGIIASLPKLIEAGKKMLQASIDGWKMMFSIVGTAAIEMVNNLKNKIIEKKNQMVEAGKTLIKSIKEGLMNAWEGVKNWFAEKVEELKEKFKDAFSINLPSWMGGNGGNNNGGSTTSSISSLSYLPSSNSYYPSSTVSTLAAANGYGSTNVTVTLEGDASRLFRVMQQEATRNAQLVGV